MNRSRMRSGEKNTFFHYTRMSISNSSNNFCQLNRQLPLIDKIHFRLTSHHLTLASVEIQWFHQIPLETLWLSWLVGPRVDWSAGQFGRMPEEKSLWEHGDICISEYFCQLIYIFYICGPVWSNCALAEKNIASPPLGWPFPRKWIFQHHL